MSGHLRVSVRDASFWQRSQIARLRAMWMQANGTLKREPNAGPVLIGPRCKMVLDEEAEIRVFGDNAYDPTPEEVTNPFLPRAAILAGETYWRYLDHPTGRRTKIRLQRRGRLVLGPNSIVCRGAYLSVWAGRTLSLDAGVYIGNDVLIATSLGMRIGRGTMIGYGTTIMDYDGHPIASGKSSSTELGGTKRPISIEEHAWIGFHCSILKGVTIGKGAIVGSRSVVTHDVPAGSIVGGNPARILEEGVQWSP